MKRLRRWGTSVSGALVCCALVGCSDPPAPASDTDSGTDTGVDTGTPPVDVGTPTDMVVPVDRSCTELMTCDAGADTGVDAGSDVGGFSTLGVRAWQSGTTRIVDDEIESSGRLCSGSGAAMVCVSGGFVR